MSFFIPYDLIRDRKVNLQFRSRVWNLDLGLVLGVEPGLFINVMVMVRK